MPVTTGIADSRMARARDSSLKAARSSREPPPRARIKTSHSARALATFPAQGRSTTGQSATYNHEIDDLPEGTYTYRVRWRGRDGRGGVSAPATIDVVRSSAELAKVQTRQQFDELHIDWTTAAEFLVQEFIVERAAADSPFVAAEAVPARGTPGAYTYAFEGLRYDCGSRQGFVQATLDYALSDPDLSESVLAQIRMLGKH